MNPYEHLGTLLGVPEDFLRRLDAAMEARTGKAGVLSRVTAESEAHMQRFFGAAGLTEHTVPKIRGALRDLILRHEEQLLRIVAGEKGDDQFERAASLARRVAQTGRGFFLKREYAARILKKRPPRHLLEFLGERDVDALLRDRDVAEVFSALRFMESQDWMHETFEVAYSEFTARDFEERDIEIKVLGPEWRTVAEQFVEKKHHNVSHLKEFGVIFLNPISEDIGGKFLRDFALLLHYFHEIEFYAKLFRRHAQGKDFAPALKALLRGDVQEHPSLAEGSWLIVQRYLFKENPNDLRLFLPHVNPESLHWARGERDLARLGEGRDDLDLEWWGDLDWVAGIFESGEFQEIISFDLEDNAMAEVSFAEGNRAYFTYHQREALWTKLFREYAGGEEKTEELLLKHFFGGVVPFS